MIAIALNGFLAARFRILDRTILFPMDVGAVNNNQSKSSLIYFHINDYLEYLNFYMVGKFEGAEMDMSFKVDSEFHRAFKCWAAELGISMKKLLEEGYALHRAVNAIDLTQPMNDTSDNTSDEKD